MKMGPVHSKITGLQGTNKNIQKTPAEYIAHAGVMLGGLIISVMVTKNVRMYIIKMQTAHLMQFVATIVLFHQLFSAVVRI